MYRNVRELTYSRNISSMPINSKDGLHWRMPKNSLTDGWNIFGWSNETDPTNLIDSEHETPFDSHMLLLTMLFISVTLHLSSSCCTCRSQYPITLFIKDEGEREK